MSEHVDLSNPPMRLGNRGDEAQLVRLESYPKRASIGAMRQQNLRVALQLVFAGSGRVTRAEIARTTGLTSATVSSLLSELIEAGYVIDGETLESTGGKRPVALHIDRSKFGILVVVVRSSLLRAAVLDLTGTITKELERSFGSPVGKEDVVSMARAVAAASTLKILAASIEIPGVLEGEVVVEAVQLGWRNVRLSTLVANEIDAPTFTVNDADAGALAEVIDGADEAVDQIYVDVSEGIGAAILEGGRLLRRSRTAGEIGHVRVDFSADAPHCRCGRDGCLEAVAAISSILDIDRIEGLSAEELSTLAGADGARGRTARAARELSVVLSLLSSTLDIPNCVLGGSAYVLGPDFIAQLREELNRDQPSGGRPITVRYAQHADPFIGAAQQALVSRLGVRWPRRPPADAAATAT